MGFRHILVKCRESTETTRLASTGNTLRRIERVALLYFEKYVKSRNKQYMYVTRRLSKRESGNALKPTEFHVFTRFHTHRYVTRFLFLSFHSSSNTNARKKCPPSLRDIFIETEKTFRRVVPMELEPKKRCKSFNRRY